MNEDRKVFSWIPNYLSFVPLHLQLVQYVRLKVVESCAVKDGFLPQPKTLSLYYGISEAIIKKAYTLLKEEEIYSSDKKVLKRDLNNQKQIHLKL